MVEYTQQDVLNTLQSMINDYSYYTKQKFNTSCNITYIVIEKNNIIASCVGIENNIIKHLRTKKEFRNCGMATLLIHKAENVIKARKYTHTIAFVNGYNKVAIQLFNKNCYLPVNFNSYYYCLKKELYD